MSEFESVASLEKLDVEALRSLARKEILAVRIPGYCPEEVCQQLMLNMTGRDGVGYEVEPTFKKFIGGAVFDGAADPLKLEAYFESVSDWYRESRAAFHPFASPADRLRLALDEVWPGGCQVERIGGRPTFVGLIRGLTVGAEARPHQDVTSWHLPESPEAKSLSTQLSCLVYFSCAEVGGLLQLWDQEIYCRAVYNAYRAPGDKYGLDRAIIGDPQAVLTPEVGEMIIFNARRIHAVTPIEAGQRFSQSFFIGYRGDSAPLTVFS